MYFKVCGELEEQKQMEDLFKKAQKPWVARLKSVEKAKLKYHKKCEKHRILMIRMRYAIADGKLTPKQVCSAY